MAVADYVNKKGQPPIELEYAFWANEYPGALPNSGGLRKQPVKLMSRMRVCFNVWTAMTEYLAADQSTKWTSANHSKWEIVVRTMELVSKRDRGEL